MKMELISYIFMPFVLGIVFTSSIFLFLEFIGFKFETKVKIKCLLPVALFVMASILLVQCALW
jgi:hypothetical protein